MGDKDKVQSGEYYAPVGKGGGQSAAGKDMALAAKLWSGRRRSCEERGIEVISRSFRSELVHYACEMRRLLGVTLGKHVQNVSDRSLFFWRSCHQSQHCPNKLNRFQGHATASPKGNPLVTVSA